MGKKEIIDSLKLVKRSQEHADADGWMPVSSQLTKYLKATPDDLIEKKLKGDKLHVCLTDGGNIVLKYA